MRYAYNEIYPDLGDPINEEVNELQHHQKKQVANTFYSIDYKVNLLPSILYMESGMDAGECSKQLLDSL